MANAPTKVEFGDFQTPSILASEVCRVLQRHGIIAGTVIEPTCGKGALLLAGADAFPRAQVVGVEINAAYVKDLTQWIEHRTDSDRFRVVHADFFQTDWPGLLAELADPLLVLGNPPWVTNAALGALDSDNLPRKSNFQGRLGLDAMTGKSNFDISESMLIQMANWLARRGGWLAVLCKTAVARKTLQHVWNNELPIAHAATYQIDARLHFEAAVDACLLVCHFQSNTHSLTAEVHPSLDSVRAPRHMGFADGQIIANMEAYNEFKELSSRGSKAVYEWRSGIKHDCSKVMEFDEIGDRLVNGLGEEVDIEPLCLYPLLKGSEVARSGIVEPRRWMLVPQQRVGDETSVLESLAPRTWRYLQTHAALLNARRSSIYRKRPRFSVFGVGNYTYLPWKVAIAGLYKRLAFRVQGPHRERPVVFDDTVYFMGCKTREQAEFLCELLVRRF